MEPNNNNNHIIVLTDATEYGKNAVNYGNLLAAIFKASLEIIPVSSPFSKKKLFSEAEEKNTIMIVIAAAQKGSKTCFNASKAIRFIKNARIPVMVVGKEPPSQLAFQQVILPVDMERQTKEKAMWASYFPRFYETYTKEITSNQTNHDYYIHILHPTYKDAFLKKKITDNIEFIEKLYQNLETRYKIYPLDKVDNPDLYALSFASQIDATLVVVMMTKFYSLIDLLFGAKEKALIGNAQGIPVLCINEREDLYVLCT